jgi:hypothetical protein
LTVKSDEQSRKEHSASNPQTPEIFPIFAGMSIRRYIAALLATYLFALVLMPCNGDCGSMQTNAKTGIHADQGHQEESEDACSPFCLCTCCTTIVTELINQEFHFTPRQPVLFFAHEIIRFQSKDCSSIWQPPKLS